MAMISLKGIPRYIFNFTLSFWSPVIIIVIARMIYSAWQDRDQVSAILPKTCMFYP